MDCRSNQYLFNHANDVLYNNSISFHEKINTNTFILLTECSKAQMTDVKSWNESEIETDTVFSVLFLKWKNKNAILSQLKLESYKNEGNDQGTWFQKEKKIHFIAYIDLFSGILTYRDMALM